ncbi:hypothetical protein [Pelagicoccus sp. SDUM812003]|uniref:hypothetical protein n=1 Tax=Pelagicoccus sp. SDUM812003 TaxID=3041267 RepID=UPI00280DEDDF|nr:hypothetical protein [Pelagicoccus sp. SDUM812003]MDQ8204491.1 hypothetical protein [Pelagicoccus sp. SDUM812003]
MTFFDEFSPVPKAFWSFETGRPFQRCTLCDRDLFEPDTNYLVEKAFRKKETVFEYAMCYDCYQEHQKTLSRKSLKLIDNYFEEHVDIEQRRKEMTAAHQKRTRSWLGHCMIKGTPRWKCEEHQIFGWFVDRDIVFNGLPYMLSGEAMDEIIQLLSPETLGVLEDFSERLFGIDLPQHFLLV